VTNLKLIILGLCAMLATALVFTAIGEVVTRPREVEALPISRVSATSTQQPSQIPEGFTPQPVLQLTLPTRPASNLATPAGKATLEPYPPPDPAILVTSTAEPYPPPGAVTSDPYPPPEAFPTEPATPDPYPPPGQTGTATVPAAFTPTVSATATVGEGSSAIRGRVLFQGQVLDEPVLLDIENQDLFSVQQITSPDGEYTVFNLLPSSRGYSILFSQDINPGFDIDEVIRWGLVRVSPVVSGEVASLPDLEISLQGLRPLAPLPSAQIANGPVTSLNPLRFEWNAYPAADQYWVELRSNRLSAPVWDSGFISATAVDFDGTLWSGASIQPGTYWWSVGVQVDELALTLSSPVWEFQLDW
jgi:hypothetical protein